MRVHGPEQTPAAQCPTRAVQNQATTVRYATSVVFHLEAQHVQQIVVLVRDEEEEHGGDGRYKEARAAEPLHDAHLAAERFVHCHAGRQRRRHKLQPNCPPAGVCGVDV